MLGHRYGDAQEYWSKVSPDLKGMLQGFEKITDVDCKGSIGVSFLLAFH